MERYTEKELSQMMTPDLQFAFECVTKAKVNRSWADRTMIKKIMEHYKDVDERAERRAQAERDAELLQATRDTRIHVRGPWTTFTERVPEDEVPLYSLYRAVRKAQGHLYAHEKKAAQLAEDFLAHPAYTLEWGGKYFDHAAAYVVAFRLREWYEEGLSVEEMTTHTKREMLRGASQASSRSTSVTSNLMEDCQRVEWTKLYQTLSEE